MINTELLRKKIEDSGYKLTFIAKQLNLSYQGFLNKLDGKNEFYGSEISFLSDFLKLSLEEKEEIFFSQKVD